MKNKISYIYYKQKEDNYLLIQIYNCEMSTHLFMIKSIIIVIVILFSYILGNVGRNEPRYRLITLLDPGLNDGSSINSG